MRLFRKKEGFTLIEFMLVLTSMSFLLVMSLGILRTGLENLKVKNDDTILKHDLNLVGLRLTRDMARAEDVRLDDSKNSILEMKITKEGEDLEWRKYSFQGDDLWFSREKKETEGGGNGEINYTRRDSLLNQVEKVSFKAGTEKSSKYVLVKIIRSGGGEKSLIWRRKTFQTPNL
ncbi:pilus assembly FimT family protein [Halarsenatibacter silvermanii]|uniref:Prepilin-type N-terminal cleavage/methylation domain-containing protein n=1 Tax=Halarsenatibacter silvermanii TaxID=321763 RepID=A0A1G9JYW8_9FIRM|nr:prepilin-type N-terminal cleavage/methylation domain-containing protein [Halarsenatibacter silvermanii]SDL42850.1 hypothetical protein SAMN04488692_104130 [Halarsenatibacter silvermanii]